MNHTKVKSTMSLKDIISSLVSANGKCENVTRKLISETPEILFRRSGNIPFCSVCKKDYPTTGRQGWIRSGERCLYCKAPQRRIIGKQKSVIGCLFMNLREKTRSNEFRVLTRTIEAMKKVGVEFDPKRFGNIQEAEENLKNFIREMDEEDGWKSGERERFETLRKETFSATEVFFNLGKIVTDTKRNPPQPSRPKPPNSKSLIPRRTAAIKRESDFEDIVPARKRFRNSVERSSTSSVSSSTPSSMNDADFQHDEHEEMLMGNISPISDGFFSGNSENDTEEEQEEKPWSAFSMYKANLLHWFPSSRITNEDIRLNFEEEIKKPGAFEKWNAKAILKNREKSDKALTARINQIYK